MLDEQPGSALAVLVQAARLWPVRSHQHPGAFQFYPVEMKLEVAFFQSGVNVVGLRLPCAGVPEHDDSGAVAGGDDALEATVIQRMILHAHGEALVSRIE